MCERADKLAKLPEAPAEPVDDDVPVLPTKAGCHWFASHYWDPLMCRNCMQPHETVPCELTGPRARPVSRHAPPQAQAEQVSGASALLRQRPPGVAHPQSKGTAGSIGNIAALDEVEELPSLSHNLNACSAVGALGHAA